MATKFNPYTALETPRYQLACFRPDLSSARLIVFENASQQRVGIQPAAARDLHSVAALYAEIETPNDAVPIPYKQIAALLKDGLDYHATHLSPSQAMRLAAVPAAELKTAANAMNLCLIAAAADAAECLYLEPQDRAAFVNSVISRPAPL